MPKRHRIQFPKSGVDKLNQDEAYFYLQGSGGVLVHRIFRFTIGP